MDFGYRIKYKTEFRKVTNKRLQDSLFNFGLLIFFSTATYEILYKLCTFFHQTEDILQWRLYMYVKFQTGYLTLPFQLRGLYSHVWLEKKVTEIEQVNFKEVKCNKRAFKISTFA
jgi:hypothetical protein